MIGVSALVALPAAGGPLRAGASIYVVRQDPRLCPSPRCGGYWVALANRAGTRCVDGELHPRCYVARAIDEQGRPVVPAIPEGSLVQGSIGPGSDDLGVLVAERAFSPVGTAAISGRYLRVVDLGIRCVRAPCFSLRAAVLNRRERITLSGIDLGAAPPGVRKRIEAALGTKSGILVRGRILQSRDGGRVLRPTRFYLPSER